MEVGSVVDSKEEIRDFYNEYGEKEWNRLDKDLYHELEFKTTMHFLEKHLPEEGKILDAGGGPGRYTIELAKKGYNVTLLDLSPKLLSIAEERIDKSNVEKNVDEVIEGSISDLKMFEDGEFDAVLCLGGALSHVLDEEERKKAVEELRRVAGKDSKIFISVIGRSAVLVRSLIDFQYELDEAKDIHREIRDTGDYEPREKEEKSFTPTHFYTPNELESELRKEELEVIETIGLEGLATNQKESVNNMLEKDQEKRETWWETHLETCTWPSAVGISEHFMAICRK